MSYRIFPMRGRTAAGRERRLNAVSHWMSARGWNLVDYSASTHQAMFEPASERAEPIRPWHFPPGYWRGLAEEWTAPRRLVVVGALGALLVTLFVINATRPAFDPRAAQRAQQANWRRVTVNVLNVREAPQGGSQIVGMVYLNQRVMVGEEHDGWVEIVEPTRGFVAARFLERVVPEGEADGEEGEEAE